jgi:hypothetical protein
MELQLEERLCGVGDEPKCDMGFVAVGPVASLAGERGSSSLPALTCRGSRPAGCRYLGRKCNTPPPMGIVGVKHIAFRTPHTARLNRLGEQRAR